MVDGIKSLTVFLEKLKGELESAKNEEQKNGIRKKYLEQLQRANEYLTGLD